MSLSDRDLKPIRQPLVVFAGETILSKGYVTLQVTIGDESTSKTSSWVIDFLVVDVPSAYNGLMGRPSMVVFKLMVASCYMLIRFRTPD